jgi:2-hydroxy-6-oxonona-2,4-dienedioate hydrolase
MEISCLITGSELIDPPWPEDAWERALEIFMADMTGPFRMFVPWLQAAPAILDFLART